MYVDSLTLVWNSAALVAGTAVSTNTIDLGGTSNRVGVGAPACLILNVEVAAVVDSTQTYRFEVITSATANLATPSILMERAFTAAEGATLLLAGKFVILPIPPGSVIQQYLGGQAVLANGGGTAGITVSGWFVPQSAAEVITRLPLGYVVS